MTKEQLDKAIRLNIEIENLSVTISRFERILKKDDFSIAHIKIDAESICIESKHIKEAVANELELLKAERRALQNEFNSI